MIRMRLATADDVAKIAPLEIAASEAFREVGMGIVADDAPIPESLLLQAVEEQRLWVAVEYGDLRAYLLGDFLPESLHIEQVTVHPEAARRGIGALLIESVSADTRVKERGSITLISFADVPWNAPYYERIGFRIVGASEWLSGIAAKVQEDQAAGLGDWERVVMRRDIVAAE